MKTIELDLSKCKDLSELHERIKVAFGFPEYYGGNWAAFWDLLWSECDADQVIIIGEETLSEEFIDQLAIMHNVLKDAVEFRKNNDLAPFSYKILKEETK